MLSKKFKEINFKELYRILLIAGLLPALKGEFPEVSRVTPLYGYYSIIPQADIAGEIGSRSSCFKS